MNLKLGDFLILLFLLKDFKLIDFQLFLFLLTFEGKIHLIFNSNSFHRRLNSKQRMLVGTIKRLAMSPKGSLGFKIGLLLFNKIRVSRGNRLSYRNSVLGRSAASRYASLLLSIFVLFLCQNRLQDFPLRK